MYIVEGTDDDNDDNLSEETDMLITHFSMILRRGGSPISYAYSPML